MNDPERDENDRHSRRADRDRGVAAGNADGAGCAADGRAVDLARRTRALRWKTTAICRLRTWFRSTDTPPDNAKHYREIQRWIRAISARAYDLARTGAIPMFLGGDHSLSMGSVNGVARHCRETGRELFVMWLDAHADYNTPATTITGNMHGMSAAFLCGEEGLDGLLGDEPRAAIDSQPA